MASTESKALKHEELEALEDHANRRETDISLERLYKFSINPTEETILQAARFLRAEIPVRLAIRARELEILPLCLDAMPSVRLIRDWFVQSFLDIIKCPSPRTLEQERVLRATFERVLRRHEPTVDVMAKGLFELSQALGDKDLGPDIPVFLDHFNHARIGFRTLLAHYLALHDPPRDGWSGVIYSGVPVADMVREAANNASNLLRRRFADAPRVDLLGRTDLTFTYIPSHLEHMLFELLKNSMRAVAEFHQKERTLPAIRVILADGQEDVSIKISDEGGGIPRSGMAKLWSYSYSTAEKPQQDVYNADQNIMAGYGWGLPLSRVYARYFGGDLQVLSMEGYGTDAYLHLRKLTSKKHDD